MPLTPVRNVRSCPLTMPGMPLAKPTASKAYSSAPGGGARETATAEEVAATAVAAAEAQQERAIAKYQKIKIKKTRNSNGSDLESKNGSVHLCKDNESVYTMRSESLRRADAACQTERGVDRGLQASPALAEQGSQAQVATQTAA